MKIEVVADEACVCGEGPIWHRDHQRLYWHDIPRGLLFSYDPENKSHQQVHAGGFIGGTTIEQDGGMLLLGEGGRVACWDGKAERVLIDRIPDETRFNDVGADPMGRVFGGMMPVDAADGGFERLGRLYLLETDGRVRVMDEGIGCANGIDFSMDGRTMYFADSNAYVVYRYTYDPYQGVLSDRRVLIQWQSPEKPDGLTVDSQGCLWVAFWDGGCVRRFDGQGQLLQTIALPTQLTTSCAFGGKDLDTLFVTSAGGDDRQTHGPLAGALFKITGLKVQGRPVFRSKMALGQD